MPSPAWRDFEIHLDEPSPDGTYPVRVRVPDEDRRGKGTFKSPYTDGDINRALGWMEQGLFDADYVKEFGARLFQALFAGEVKAVYDGARQSSDVPLRFRLIIDAPAVARFPWELLYDPDRPVFLSLAGPFVRGVSTTERTRPLTVEPPLRVLVIDAFPKGVLKVENQAETTGIRQALAGLIRGRRVEVQTLSHATLETLQNALREANAARRPIHLLHFIGHGQHHPATGRTVLLFEDEGGQIDEVDAEALCDIVRPYNLRLVFLNACQSMQSSALDVAKGFAPALLAGGVPAVIGMQVTVLDEVAVAFSRRFYEALADNQPVDAALADARQLARGTRLRRKADLGIPVCYLRSGTGQILELQPAKPVPLTRETWRPWLRERATPRWVVSGVVGLISLIATVLGLVTDIVPFLPSRPAPMTGDFNVAVAEFGQLDDRGRIVESVEAERLAQSFTEALAGEVRTELNKGIQVGGSYIVKVDQTRRMIKDENDAEKLASQINAHVIVYGSLEPGVDETGFVPRFYISRGDERVSEELLGQYQLGAKVVSRGPLRNAETHRDLNGQLLGRTRAFAQFVLGMSLYVLDKYPEAMERFKAAEATPGWSDPDFKRMLYLFEGNTAGRRKDLTAAQGYYARALELNPKFARARLGLAEVQFQTSKGKCEEGQVDVAGLQKAIAGFQGALAAGDQLPGADIQTKATLDLGRVYLCLSQALVDNHWGDAERFFKEVIVVFEKGNKRAREHAATAHAGLGVVFSPSEGDSNAVAKYHKAIAEYEAAIRLTRHQAEKEEYAANLTHLQSQLSKMNLKE